MKKILFIFLLALPFILPAQSWLWTKKINNPANQSGYFALFHNQKMLTDKDSNLYFYGSRNYASYSDSYAYQNYYGYENDTSGSFLQVYSGDGTLFFTKLWKIPFHLIKMAYDGNEHFYFSAIFYGYQTIDGISISSEGKGDGVVGKMNLYGDILWMKTLGGPEMDFNFGIDYNEIDSTVYFTGAIWDSLSFNNVLDTVCEQSAIIGNFSASGNLIRYKLFDFVPERDLRFNCGIEIENDVNGNIFALMDRDGQNYYTYEDTLDVPIVGRYLFKFNSMLDTLWSTYIIGPSCEYGWSCRALKIAVNGDAYLTKYCAGHGSGTGTYLRIDGITGLEKFSLYSSGGYADLAIDSTTVYLIGIEKREYFPRPWADEGYHVIKIIDYNNVTIGETRIDNRMGIYLNFVCLGGNSIFINGFFLEKSAVFGPDTLIADSTNNGYYYSYKGSFLSKLNTSPCTPPEISVSVNRFDSYSYGTAYPICPGDSALLSVNATGSFQWTNGDTTSQIYAINDGLYSAVNSQPNGCIAYSVPVEIRINGNPGSHKICMVTFDSLSGRNKIIIKAGEDPYDIIQLKIFRESNGNIFQIHSQQVSNTILHSAFTDTTTDPAESSVSYVVSTTDSCGTTSPLSLNHRSIFLQVNRNFYDNNVLSWNLYEGNPVSGYMIWRGNSPLNMAIIDSVDSTTTQFTDFGSSDSSLIYQVQALMPIWGCYINSTSYYSSKSNPAKNNGLFLKSDSPENNYSFTIHPNPAFENFEVNLFDPGVGEKKLNIMNSVGEIVFSEKFHGNLRKKFQLRNYPKGIYLVEISSTEKRQIRKISLH